MIFCFLETPIITDDELRENKTGQPIVTFFDCTEVREVIVNLRSCADF